MVMPLAIHALAASQRDWAQPFSDDARFNFVCSEAGVKNRG